MTSLIVSAFLRRGFSILRRAKHRSEHGTAYQNGQYIANVLNGSLSAQWTPLFGTTTSYSNSIVRYSDSNVAQVQNSIENTDPRCSPLPSFPKVSLSVGGIADKIGYDSTDRGYNSYTGFVGANGGPAFPDFLGTRWRQLHPDCPEPVSDLPLRCLVGELESWRAQLIKF